MVAVVEDSVKGSATISLDSGGCERERRGGRTEGEKWQKKKGGEIRITIFLSNVHNWVRGGGRREEGGGGGRRGEERG